MPKHPYRSDLENRIATELSSSGIKVLYETLRLKYEVHKECTYTPDFELPNGIIIEVKGPYRGAWTPAERQKQLLVREYHPHLDIRLVFGNAYAKINSRAKTTCAQWCDKNGFKWANKSIPEEWIEE